MSKDVQQEVSVEMKSVCFSNMPEGLNVNVIAVGLSNGNICLWSTWDLTLLRIITIKPPIELAPVSAIISLTYTRDGKRIYALDSNERVYVLETPSMTNSLIGGLIASTQLQTNQAFASFYYE